jgi:hypothetical protein
LQGVQEAAAHDRENLPPLALHRPGDDGHSVKVIWTEMDCPELTLVVTTTSRESGPLHLFFQTASLSVTADTLISGFRIQGAMLW